MSSPDLAPVDSVDSGPAAAGSEADRGLAFAAAAPDSPSPGACGNGVGCGGCSETLGDRSRLAEMALLGLLERSRSDLTVSTHVRNTLANRQIDSQISANRQSAFVLLIASCTSKIGSLCWRKELGARIVDSQRSTMVHKLDQAIDEPTPDGRQIWFLSISSTKFTVSLHAGLQTMSSHACIGQQLGPGPICCQLLSRTNCSWRAGWATRTCQSECLCLSKESAHVMCHALQVSSDFIWCLFF